MTNFDEGLVDLYMDGNITIEQFTVLTGKQPLGLGYSTRYMAQMKLMEKILERLQ